MDLATMIVSWYRAYFSFSDRGWRLQPYWLRWKRMAMSISSRRVPSNDSEQEKMLNTAGSNVFLGVRF